MKQEIRFLLDHESRVEDEDTPKIRGYAARFNKPSKGLPWKERIKKGAFSKTIQESDIRALWNHNADFPLGRSKTGTLELEEDEKGLRVVIDPPATSWGNDAVEAIKRRDVTGMSIGFMVTKDSWNEKQDERLLEEIQLFEVSPVVFPAYPSTSVGVRAMVPEIEDLDLDIDQLTATLFRCSRGHDVTVKEVEFLTEAIEYLRGFIPIPQSNSEPPKQHSDAEIEPPEQHSLEARLLNAEISLRQKEVI